MLLNSGYDIGETLACSRRRSTLSALFRQLQATLAELQQHPLLSVERCTIGPPASPDQLEAVERSAGLRLPADIRDFYAAADGVDVRWRLRGDEEAEIELRQANPQHFGFDFHQPIGSLRLLNVKTMLMNQWWAPFQGDSPFEFGSERTTVGEFGQRLRPFDVFHPNNDWQIMSLLISPDGARFQMLLLGDHGADWQHSRLTDFETYLRAVCATRLCVPAREWLFGEYRGDRKPPLSFAELPQDELVPPLFRA